MVADKGDAASRPLVSVVCVTYNHEEFIEEALSSFLAQETRFPFEILVADDCSSDQTRDILRRYASLHPNMIKLVLPDKNRGAERNLISMCEAAQGRYVALCDGDDYWVRTDKLQAQVDYMEAHPNMRACFHDTEIVLDGVDSWFLEPDYCNTKDGVLRWCTGHKKFVKRNSYTLNEYIGCGFVHSSSMFFRWDRDREIPEWFYHHILGDYTLWCIQVGLGEFGYLDEVMSVYRRHAHGGYNFASREEFWLLTRPDWLRIDDDLKGYFVALGAPDELLACFDRRKKEDLRKLVKATVILKDRSAVDGVIGKNARELEAFFGIPLYRGEGRVARSHNYHAVASIIFPQTTFRGKVARKVFRAEGKLRKTLHLSGAQE